MWPRTEQKYNQQNCYNAYKIINKATTLKLPVRQQQTKYNVKVKERFSFQKLKMRITCQITVRRIIGKVFVRDFLKFEVILKIRLAHFLFSGGSDGLGKQNVPNNWSRILQAVWPSCCQTNSVKGKFWRKGKCIKNTGNYFCTLNLP